MPMKFSSALFLNLKRNLNHYEHIQKGKKMIPDTRLKTLKHFEELLKDSERLEWLIKLVDHLGIFNDDDIKEAGVNNKNFKKFIDLMMAVPIDELLADLEQD